ncbi:PL29 family lyase N-terminal domain-containing protein [uncultured Alistipes sp.]|uniref:PL29 family lyase N-terminal domain-containing protein n=1 Tax=uncultured Alistipes sp. TaxID=538949 RepID=UPI00320AA18B
MKKYLILFFVAAAAAFQSCDNNDDLWDAIDDLKSRVQALETQVDALNGNVEALQTLYNGGATISEVTESDGAYVLKLTDGTTLTLSQGSEAEAVIPVVSIDENGNWQYSVDGGEKFIPLNVNAVAEDGVTPQFRIDEKTGCWQVNTTGEESGWTNVKNSAGQDVSAVGGTMTDKFFDTVRVDGDTLYIKLLGSDVELEIPIVPDVLCAIVDAEGKPIEGIQMFDSGMTKRFDVKMRGIDNTIVTAPEGWTARLTDAVDEKAELVVTAPGKQASAGTTATRATANTSQDVAILATSGKYSFISKIQVQSTGVEAEPPTVTSVTSSVATDVTLMFDVQIANADGWKYICLESGSEAPDAAKVFAEGTAVLGTSVTVEGLKAETEYTIYVVAYIGEQYSEVSTATASTVETPPDPNDYYASGVEVNGTRYDKDSEGARLLEVASDAGENVTVSAPSTATVSFIGLDESDTYDFVMASTSSIGVQADNIYIGRYADAKPTIKFGRYLTLRNAGGTLAFKNLVLDFEAVSDNYMFNSNGNNAGIGTLIFEDCEIIYAKQSLITGYKGTGSIGNIIFRNCKIRYTGTETTYVVNLSNPGSLDLSVLTGFTLENSIIYATQSNTKNSAFLTANNQDLSNMALIVERNTFVDLRGSGTTVNSSALFVLSKFGSILCKNNLFYATIDTTYPAVFALTNDYDTAWPTIDMLRSDNISYGSQGWKIFSEITGAFHPSSYDVVTVPKVSSDPLTTCDPATGTFVVSSEYAGYGSTLE